MRRIFRGILHADGVAWSLCLFVIMIMSPAKTAALIEMPSGMWGRGAKDVLQCCDTVGWVYLTCKIPSSIRPINLVQPTNLGPRNHVLDGALIGTTWRIRWIDLCGLTLPLVYQLV